MFSLHNCSETSLWAGELRSRNNLNWSVKWNRAAPKMYLFFTRLYAFVFQRLSQWTGLYEISFRTADKIKYQKDFPVLCQPTRDSTSI